MFKAILGSFDCQKEDRSKEESCAGNSRCEEEKGEKQKVELCGGSLKKEKS